MTAFLLVIAEAWAVAARGGTSARALAFVIALLVAANVVSGGWPPISLPSAASVLTLFVWLVVDGPVRVGATQAAIRGPMLLVLVALAAQAVRTLDGRARSSLALGLILIGCLQACVTLGQVAAGPMFGHTLSRGSGTVGSPNGLGVLLVSTAVLAGSGRAALPGWFRRAALAALGAAIIATGSRTSVAIGCLVLLGWAAAVRRPVAWALSAVGALALAGVFWARLGEPPEQRFHLWRQALTRITLAPFAGSGPEPQVFSRTGPNARLTTHAHNEILQWTLEYGLIGLVLVALVVLSVLRDRGGWSGGRDWWFAVSAAVLLAAGMTDFTLRITALALMTAILGTLALTTATPAAPRADAPASRANSGKRPRQ